MNEGPIIDPNVTAEIEACGYLSLRKLYEPKGNSLVAVLDEAVVDANAYDLTLGGVRLENVRNIEVGKNSRAFEFFWDQYIAYGIGNERFVCSSDDEVVESGRLLRVYKKSNFLDYISKATWGHTDRRVVHIGLICLNHIVDVASTEPPRIRLL